MDTEAKSIESDSNEKYRITNTIKFLNRIGWIQVRTFSKVLKGINEHFETIIRFFLEKKTNANVTKVKIRCMFNHLKEAAMTFLGCFSILDMPEGDISMKEDALKKAWIFFQDSVVVLWKDIDLHDERHLYHNEHWNSSWLFDPPRMWRYFLRVEKYTSLAFHLHVTLLVEWARTNKSSKITRQSMVLFHALTCHIAKYPVNIPKPSGLNGFAVNDPDFCNSLGFDPSKIKGMVMSKLWTRALNSLKSIEFLKDMNNDEIHSDVSFFFTCLRFDSTAQYKHARNQYQPPVTGIKVGIKRPRDRAKYMISQNKELYRIHDAIDVAQNTVVLEFMRSVCTKFQNLPNHISIERDAWNYLKQFFIRWKLIDFEPEKSIFGQIPQDVWEGYIDLNDPIGMMQKLATHSETKKQRNFPHRCSSKMFSCFQNLETTVLKMNGTSG